MISETPTSPIPRVMLETAEERLHGYPVVTITGPRQSGKTTLARLLRPNADYFSLEDPDLRSFALEDPRGFLQQCGDAAILDEVQRVPELFSYLQGMVDAKRKMGRFILTGSSQFELMGGLTQSLAGRSSLLTLFPFSASELLNANRFPLEIDELLLAGCFPPVYDRQIEPTVWLQDYVGTYLERDVRSILNIQDLNAFQRFVRLCAGRVGQLLNMTSLASDAGINRATAQSWLSVLEASHLIFLLPPWHSNLSKRMIKSPKLYFTDVGLAAWFLGAKRPSHLAVHPLRGLLFENWVVMELVKSETNRGVKPAMYFLRDKQGHEIDVLIEDGPTSFRAVEVKSGQTISSDAFSGLDYWRKHLPKIPFEASLIYGGETRQSRRSVEVIPWREMPSL